MSKLLRPATVTAAAVLAALPAIVLLVWTLFARTIPASAQSVATEWTLTSELLVLLPIMACCLLISFGLLRRSRIALVAVRVISWAILAVFLFASVYNIVHWDPFGLLLLAAICLLPATAMLVVTKRARTTGYFDREQSSVVANE